MTVFDHRSGRRRRRRAGEGAALRWTVRLALALVVFGVGVAVGQALQDNPQPTGPVTFVRTLTGP